MNNRDLAALAALGAMGYMYNEHMKGKGAGPAADAGRYPPAEDYVNRDAVARQERFPPYADVGTGGAGGRSDAARDAGAAIAGGNRDLAGEQRANSGVGNGGIRARDVVYGGGKGGRRGGNGAGTPIVSFTGNGSGYDRPFLSGAAAPDVVPEVAPEESSGMGGAGFAAAGAGVAGAGAAAYYAKVKREARLADEARAKLKAEARAGILKDQALDRVTEDRDARARAQNEADRAARAQAQAEAEAKSRATQERVDSELRNNRTVRNDINERAAVLNKDMWAAGPTVTSETPTKKRAPVKVEAPTDMDDFNRMLRESKVGRATTTTTPAAKTPKVRNLPGKVGAALTLAGLGGAANAATDMTAGQRERLARDVMEGLISPLGVTPGMAGEGSDIGFSDKPLSSAERKKMIEAMSPADRKKMEEALARQNPKLLDAIKRPSAANQRAAGGQIKAKKMASGGMTSTVSSASKRGDGIASKGKTRCKIY